MHYRQPRVSKPFKVYRELYPPIAIKVYLWKIRLTHDNWSINNNWPEHLFPVKLPMHYNKVHVAHVPSFTVLSRPYSGTGNHCRYSSCAE